MEEGRFEILVYLPEGVIEGHAVDHIVMLVEGEQLFAGVGVPNLAGAIVGTGNEFVSALVEGTVGQGQQMRPQDFVQFKFLFLIFHLFLDKF